MTSIVSFPPFPEGKGDGGIGGCAAAALALLLAPLAAAGDPAVRLGPAPRPQIRRVVTLAPSLTELVLALGAGDRLVGVSRFDDAPEVRPLPRVGGFTDPSPEAVVACRPDLVLAATSPGNKRPVETIAALGIPVLAVALHTMADVETAARTIAETLGVPDRGTEMAVALAARRQRVRERARALPRRRALLVVGWDPFVVVGPASFAGEILRDAGGANVVDEASGPFPAFDAERAVARAPQVVLDAADVAAPARERLLRLPALREARVVRLSTSLLRPGPRLADALEEVFRALHPEAGQP